MARATPRTLLIVLLPYLGCLLYAWAELQGEFDRSELSWDIQGDYYDVPLVQAARLKSHARAQRILDLGEDPDRQRYDVGPTPLLMSIAMGDIPMINLLLDGGADIEKWGQLDPSGAEVLPLDYACMYRGRGRVDVMIELLIRGADIDGSGIHTCENHDNQNIMDITQVAQEWKAEGRSIEAEHEAFLEHLKEVVFHGHEIEPTIDPWTAHASSICPLCLFV